jgi:transcriptional regulator with XRE-family HTH domain
MDENTREVMEGLKQALADSGLNQADFAAALGTSASRFSTYRSGQVMPTAGFYLRALRLAADLRAAREHGWMTPQAATREIRQAVREGDDIWALKMALQARDHLHELLRIEDPAADAWRGAPRSTGDARWDAFLAALAEHEFEEAGRGRLGWTEARRLAGRAAEWVMPSLRLDEDGVRAATPAWLSRWGVFAAERDLVTA